MIREMMCDFKFKTKPYEHQVVCFERSRDQKAFAIFAEMGCGKSKILIDTIAYLHSKGEIDGALILAKKGTYLTWVDTEIPTHMPDYVAYECAAWFPNPRQAEKKAMDALSKPSGKLQIFVMNTEALSTKKGVEAAQKFLLGHKAMFAIDESTDIKHSTSTRTKAVLKLRKLAEYRRIMSGEPAAERPLDLYSQFEFLDPEMLGYGSFFSFRNHFAVMKEVRLPGRGSFKTVVGYQNVDELAKIIAPHSFIVKKADCLDLPQKIYQMRYVELGKDQRVAYDQMEENAVVEIERLIAEKKVKLEAMTEMTFEDLQAASSDSTELISESTEGPLMTANMVMIQLLRLHQIVCGFMTVDAIDPDAKSREIRVFEENPRLDAMLEDLEMMHEKVIIWANYRYDIANITRKISEKFGKDSVVTYYGDTSVDDRRLAVKRFQDPNDPCRFFVSNPSTGGYGITLTQAGYVLYYSNGYEREKRGQSEDRAHRIGQNKNVVYYDYCARGTVDEKIIAVLKSKKSMSEMITPSNWRQLFNR